MSTTDFLKTSGFRVTISKSQHLRTTTEKATIYVTVRHDIFSNTSKPTGTSGTVWDLFVYAGNQYRKAVRDSTDMGKFGEYLGLHRTVDPRKDATFVFDAAEWIETCVTAKSFWWCRQIFAG